MNARMAVLDEWTYVVKVDARRGRCAVECRNPVGRDREFAQALARVIRIWVERTGLRPAASRVREEALSDYGAEGSPNPLLNPNTI